MELYLLMIYGIIKRYVFAFLTFDSMRFYAPVSLWGLVNNNKKNNNNKALILN